MTPLTLFTIGFTHKSAEEFFTLLRDAGVRRVADVRLNNTSQLAAFTKKDDLVYFLREIVGIPYVHLPDLAPTQAMLDAYKKLKGDWAAYERDFLKLLEKRRVAATLSRDLMDGACLLCSEAEPEHCHRRVITDYLAAHWPGVSVRHLVTPRGRRSRKPAEDER